MRFPGFLLLVILSIGGSFPLSAQTTADQGSARTLRVGIQLDDPFNMKSSDGKYTGYATDIWERIAGEQGWKYEYTIYPSPSAILDAIAKGEVDIGATNITVTAERLRKADFSQSIMEAGLRIMVDDTRKNENPLWKMVRQKINFQNIGIFAAIIFSLTVIVLLLERRFNSDFPRHWGHGLVEAFYHVMLVIFTGKTSGHKPLPEPWGRLLAAIWAAVGVLLIATITATITSTLTVSKLQGEINGPGDLPGKNIGVISGTVGETYCRNNNINYQSFATLPEAVKVMLDRKIDAIVYDAPVLEYYDHIHPELPISEVGPVFKKNPYAFAFAPGSPLRSLFNQRLFDLKENGYLSTLHAQYYGEENTQPGQ